MTAASWAIQRYPREPKKHHLVFPCVRAQRPAMAEDHGLSATPVLVIYLRTVFRCNRAHWFASFFIGWVDNHLCLSNDKACGLFRLPSAKVLCRKAPVNQFVDNSIDVVRTAVLIIQVIGVFPDIYSQ